MNIQRGDGLFGSLIIREYENRNENAYLNQMYDFDLDEHVLILNDWANETAYKHYSVLDFKIESILINGKAAHKKFDTIEKKQTYEKTLELVQVKKGYKYRFRLINAGYLFCPLQFSIENHNITIIATDGSLVKPIELESLVIYSG
mgnify:CR=1 FL=1